MDFAKPFTGNLLYLEQVAFQGDNGNTVEFAKLEILADVDGQKRALHATASKSVLNGYEFRPGMKVTGELLPGKGDKVRARNITPAT